MRIFKFTDYLVNTTGRWIWVGYWDDREGWFRGPDPKNIGEPAEIAKLGYFDPRYFHEEN